MSVTLHVGDALEVLRTLPAGLARCCVTSPPYWGLRDYGPGEWVGGEPGCQHRGRPKPRQDTSGAPGLEHGRFAASRGTQPSKDAYAVPVRDVCRCGARRVDRQLGLEAAPELYVERMVEVFREVRRVLTDDGTLWLNIGDSYAAGCMTGRQGANSSTGVNQGQGMATALPARKPANGLKPKDLTGIPWRVAFALQADGWWLRSDIIWAKPNPMPESVRDRPTKAHEYLFLLSKRTRYYYDAEAISEPGEWCGKQLGIVRSRKSRAVAMGRLPSGNDRRNRRTVWTITTQPYPEAHFATYPPALVEPCIRAGSAPGDVVLDPFAGAGTTGLVARRLGRSFVGIELNREYAEMASRRIRDDAPLLNDVTVVEASA